MEAAGQSEGGQARCLPPHTCGVHRGRCPHPPQATASMARQLVKTETSARSVKANLQRNHLPACPLGSH